MKPIGQKVRLIASTKPRAVKAVAPIKAAAPMARAKAPGAMSVDVGGLDTMHQLPGKPGHFRYKG
jgi:hypothetical protein